MALPHPTTNPETYLAEILKQLEMLNESVGSMVKELQRLNDVATQKPSIQLDVVKLADNITAAIQSQSKKVTSKAG